MTERRRGEPFPKNAIDILLEEKFLKRSIPFLEWSATMPAAETPQRLAPKDLRTMSDDETTELLDRIELIRLWLEAHGTSIYRDVERKGTHDETLEFTNSTYQLTGDFYPSAFARAFALRTTLLSIHKNQGDHCFGFTFNTDKTFYCFVEFNHKKRLVNRMRYQFGVRPLSQMDEEQLELASAVLDDFTESEMGIVFEP